VLNALLEFHIAAFMLTIYLRFTDEQASLLFWIHMYHNSTLYNMSQSLQWAVHVCLHIPSLNTNIRSQATVTQILCHTNF
jgi:hypothetical protein